MVSRQLVEDSRVELKSVWPDEPYKAARQIAGHANAARGEPILWLIGIDEKMAIVTGADYEEISNWKQSIDACFNELAPTLSHINVPYENKTVVALLWETDRRPFLVKNPIGRPVSLEVPWRDASSTRTATRTDLLRLLYPVSKAPSFELIEGSFTISTVVCDDHDQSPKGGLSLDVYVIPGSSERVIIPFHKCEANLRFLSSGLCLALNHISFGSLCSLPGTSIFEVPTPSPAVICTGSEAVIDGPGRTTISAKNPPISSEKRNLIHGDMELTIKMSPIGADIPISIRANLRQIETPKGAMGHWIIQPK